MDLSWLGFGGVGAGGAPTTPTSSPRKGASNGLTPTTPLSFSAAHVNDNSDDSDDESLSRRGGLTFRVAEGDLIRYWIGTWKRTLEWREFGGNFGHLRESNTVVLIEEVQRLESEIGVRHLRWSFGKSLQRSELRSGYVMKCTAVTKLNEVTFEWQYAGALCTGRFMATVGLAVLNFWTKTACITVMYRILDADSMAVSITEVDDKKEASIQYGNMYRIDAAAYAHLPVM